MVFTARLTVLGSLNMDISVTVPDLPVPGATVLGRAAVFAPGGKGANQAVAAARLAREAGMPVAMIGCAGDDDFGRTLRAALRAEGVDDGAVRTVAGVPTGIAMITVDRAGENMITVSPGANHEVSAADIAGLAVEAGDVLVISAEVPIPLIGAALAATAGRALRVLNLAPAPPPAKAAELVALGPDWLVVNESEAAAVLGRAVAGLAEAAEAASDLVAAGARNAVVTAGAAGAAYCAPAATKTTTTTAAADVPNVVTVPGFKVTAVDTVGAGDTFVGALAVALAAGVPPLDAVTAAAAAGAAAAARPGTQSGMPSPADVLAATGHPWPVPAS
ncbi:MAG TPA: PfkB family carbohydrate kinase [Trebonia sp.]|nr:PfkB family carbohydrate kinase [Trebonia sp.]